MITIEYVKTFLWLVYISWFVWFIGSVVKAFGFKTFGIVIQGISAIFLIGESIVSLPIVHWLIFDYWRGA